MFGTNKNIRTTGNLEMQQKKKKKPKQFEISFDKFWKKLKKFPLNTKFVCFYTTVGIL